MTLTAQLKVWGGGFGKQYTGRNASDLEDRDPGLRLVREEHYPYLEGDNVDCMYLLERSGG